MLFIKFFRLHSTNEMCIRNLSIVISAHCIWKPSDFINSRVGKNYCVRKRKRIKILATHSNLCSKACQINNASCEQESDLLDFVYRSLSHKLQSDNFGLRISAVDIYEKISSWIARTTLQSISFIFFTDELNDLLEKLSYSKNLRLHSHTLEEMGPKSCKS